MTTTSSAHPSKLGHIGGMIERVLSSQGKAKDRLKIVADIIDQEKRLHPGQQTVQIGLAPLEDHIDEMRKTLRFFRPVRFWVTVVAVAVILVIIGLFFKYPQLYVALYTPITGEPFTHIMRRIPAYYLLGLGVVLAALSLLPSRAYIRVIIISLVFISGFVGGHVFWGGGAGL